MFQLKRFLNMFFIQNFKINSKFVNATTSNRSVKTDIALCFTKKNLFDYNLYVIHLGNCFKSLLNNLNWFSPIKNLPKSNWMKFDDGNWIWLKTTRFMRVGWEVSTIRNVQTKQIKILINTHTQEIKTRRNKIYEKNEWNKNNTP